MSIADSERPSPVTAIAVRICCGAVWLALGLLLALLLFQWRRAVLHPTFILFIVLTVLAIMAAMAALGLVVWRLIRFSNRRATALWGCAAILPLVLFAVPFESVRGQWAERQVPRGALGHIVIITAASIMEGHAAYLYPHRLETERLIMFYHDLSRPQLDAEMMDHHVAQLETKVGYSLRSKIHWVRGSLIGQGNCSFLGLALGSTESPDWAQNQDHLDRHELAHAVIAQQRPVSADPPMLLHEGWAESQSGVSSIELAGRALQVRESNPSLRVADLFGTEWYHRDIGPVYFYGGAFVDYLIERFGPEKFVAIYNRCQPHSFEEDVQAVYGESLAELEAAFWSAIVSPKQP